MRPALSEGKHICGRVGTTPCASCALDIVGSGRWHVPHNHSLQIPYVYPDFERGGTAKDVDVPLKELFSHTSCFSRGQLRCMFVCNQHCKFIISVPVEICI